MKLTNSYSDSKCSRRPALDGVLDTLGQPEHARADLVAHLHEVVQRQLGDGVGVRLAPLGIHGHRLPPLVGGLGEAAVELDDVLEGAVHPLAEEGDDGVGGITEQRQPPPHPRPDAHRDQRADRIAGELAGEVVEQLRGVGIVAVEAGADGRGIVEAGEPRRPVERPEQRGGEAVVAVGQGDHHRVPPRPDVQGAGVEGEVARRIGCDGQLLVPPRQVLLAVVGALAAHDRVAQRAVCAVGADHHVVDRRAAAVDALHRQLTCVGDDTDRTLLEVHDHPRLLLRGVEQYRIESVAGDRVDRLGPVRAVRLECQLAVTVVDHAAAHRQPVGEHLVGEPHALEGVDPPRREGQVDRAPRRARPSAGRAGARRA